MKTEVRPIRERADVKGCDWSVVWVAGASTVASTDQQTAREADQLGQILDAMRTESVGDDRGSFFFPSTVGAVYTGTESSPLTEETSVAATSAYGRLKLELEG